MKARRETRFDVDTLRDLAGEKVFARGQAYHRDGQVELLAVEPRRVLARVAGTEDYRTELTGQGDSIGGECSCPAYEDWGFCKHMVATALAANALGSGAEAVAANPLARIRDHLRRQSAETLVDIILGLAERDPALFHKLEMAAAVVNTDDKTIVTRLRKAIDRATRTDGYIHYREAPDWAADVGAALESVDQLVAAGRGAPALELAERAIGQIEQAIGAIDDSDGHCGALLHRCRDIHLAAAYLVRPEPIQLAQELFAREMASEYDTFGGAAAVYAEVLGDLGLAEYRRLAVEAWKKAPPLSGRGSGSALAAGDHYRLVNILDFFAEREDDTDAWIALRAKNLSSSWAYLQFAEFCLAHGREDEALRRAEEGLWMFEDGRPDERLVTFAAGLLSKANRREEAEALLQRIFEKAPSLELYTQLREFGPRGRGRAIECLQMRLAEEAPSRWYYPADLLIRVLMRENLFEQAWAAVRRHSASVEVKEALARASEAEHPREAIEVYTERIEHLVDGGGNPAYVQAVELIGRMARLRSPAEHDEYVLTLTARFGRKRNFIKLLG